jgi:hypothetical protein
MLFVLAELDRDDDADAVGACLRSRQPSGSLPGETDQPMGGLPILEGAGRGVHCRRAYCRQRVVERLAIRARRTVPGRRVRANGRGRWLTG